MTKIKVMSVAYERPVSMRILMDCFLVQTNPNWSLTIIHDGNASDNIHNIVALYDDPRIIYKESPERYQTYGHPNRKIFLSELEGVHNSFILLTNDDNYYVPVFVQEILNKCVTGVGMVYWDTVHSHFGYDILKSEIKVDRIDIGSFVVREDVAHATGFNNFAFNGDGHYAVACAMRCRDAGLKIIYIPKPLFIHN